MISLARDIIVFVFAMALLVIARAADVVGGLVNGGPSV